MPKDTIQAAALVTLMKGDGCTKVAMTNDKEVYGAGLARVIELSAKEQGLTLTGNDAIDKNASNYRSIASKAKAAGADCFVFSGITANNAVQQFKDFAAALGPDAKLYGPDGVCETGFVSEKDGGIPASLDPQVKCTVATLTPDQYPPAGQDFFKAFTEKYGVDNPDPYAIYGYEAMSLALDAIEPLRRNQGGHQEGPLRDQGPRERARHVLDRRERRHDAHRLRRIRRRERRAEVRPDDQGEGPLAHRAIGRRRT